MIARPYQRVAWWPRVSLCREFCKREGSSTVRRRQSRPHTSGPRDKHLGWIRIHQWIRSFKKMSFFGGSELSHSEKFSALKTYYLNDGPPLSCSYLVNKTSMLDAAGMAELPWSALTPGWCRRLSCFGLVWTPGDGIPHVYNGGLVSITRAKMGWHLGDVTTSNQETHGGGEQILVMSPDWRSWSLTYKDLQLWGDD